MDNYFYLDDYSGSIWIPAYTEYRVGVKINAWVTSSGKVTRDGSGYFTDYPVYFRLYKIRQTIYA